MGQLARAVCFSTHDDNSEKSQERFDTVGGQKAVQQLPPKCAIVGSGDGEVRLHETGELEDCASCRRVASWAQCANMFELCASARPFAQPERSVAMMSRP